MKRSRQSPVLMRLLKDRFGRPLPRSWFQRLAKKLIDKHGISLVEELEVRDPRGRLLAQLDLAHVETKVGVECQSVAYHGTPNDRQRDAERRRKLRWEIVEVWWSDLERMDAVLDDLRIVISKAEALVGVTKIAGLAITDTRPMECEE
jgi:hypothetical protein